MPYSRFAFGVMLLFSAACSNDERETSFVPEAQAAQVPVEKDYGWRTTPQYPTAERDVREYQ